LVETNLPEANADRPPPDASAPSIPPAASPSTPAGQPPRDFLEPDVRAKLEAMKKKKKR